MGKPTKASGVLAVRQALQVSGTGKTKLVMLDELLTDVSDDVEAATKPSTEAYHGAIEAAELLRSRLGPVVSRTTLAKAEAAALELMPEGYYAHQAEEDAPPDEPPDEPPGDEPPADDGDGAGDEPPADGEGEGDDQGDQESTDATEGDAENDGDEPEEETGEESDEPEGDAPADDETGATEGDAEPKPKKGKGGKGKGKGSK